MKRARRDRRPLAQTHSQDTQRSHRLLTILLFLGVAFTLTSVLTFAPASSAQDSPTNRIECSNPPDDFVIYCLAFEKVVDHFVDGVVAADLAEAAIQGLIGADLAPRTTHPPPCAVPAPEFEAVCAEIDKIQDTRAAALVATSAMLESLNDTYTRYLMPVQTRRFFSLLDAGNSRAGIGIEYALLGADGQPCSALGDTCFLTIVEVYPGSPADLAGLMVGDVIVEYNKTVAEHTCSELLDLDDWDYLGESATLVARRGGVEIHRLLGTAEVVDPLVSSRIVDDSIGYIRLDVFATGAAELFAAQLSDLLSAGVESIVVDLRDNPGGYLSVTAEIVDLFLAMGDLNHRIQSVREDSSFFADSDGIASDAIALPMAVAVNDGSASGSELFILAMRGNNRAKIVGTATYGKSTGQVTFTGKSANGTVLGAVNVTSLRFFGPDGLSPSGGIQPDTVSEISPCAHPIGVAREAAAALVPRVSQLAFTSTPAADSYETGEKVTVTVQFDAPVVVDTEGGEPSLDLEIGNDVRKAAYVATSTDDGVSTVEFEYTLNDDADYDGISIGADSINLNGATIRRAAVGWDAHLDHPMLAADPAQIVAADPERYFTDIAETSFVDAINWLRHAGITTGCGTDTYCPDLPVTRGQMAAFLNRALQLPAADQDYFSDDDTSTFQDDINRLRHAGITTGCGPDTYCADLPVTRGQMAAFLNRALQLPAADQDYFSDDDTSTFQDDINRLRHAGITTGCGPDTYCADLPVTRGQMAAFLYRARDLIAAARQQTP